ncbi:HesA/MoeB/ThiF family protein [Acidihalobacter ferrooxydans]|uniref:Molybdopterin-synthase adenylyltransferase n=1 Tax=Acidihalobacter ferrooxydans TaxID=1765967 RepID=A0A1P8UJY1_9GAMM|nr:molybdopterin-synthase adenylyltransferase MoeB [Acidihalobacter ferrooxydans]APZ44131.1 hypothetical protein BW247_14375 [Acidihalobacter ferrooxydans]
MNDRQLLRYSRQLMLPQLDYSGQERLLRSRTLIVGLGGLGSPVALYLAAAGVGTLVLADFDSVDLSNLQRQIAHTTATIGQSKAISAAAAAQSINPEVEVECIDDLLSPAQFMPHVAAADVVIDCTDNFVTRFTLNALCMEAGTPLVSGAAIRFEGQVTVFDPRRDDSPCYRCLYPDELDDEENCSRNGILAPVVGMIGTTQATEAIKVLAGIGEPLVGRLLLLDALHMEWRSIRLARDPQCPVCAHRMTAAHCTTRSA